MADTDLNLLTALDALLAEGSVAGAARRLNLSASAMSRTLARLRAATGDPLLVRAGRGLVPTPRATELRGRVRELAQEVQAVLRPAAGSARVPATNRVFTIRANEGFIELFAAPLVNAVWERAPGVRLRFAPKPDKDARPLREGLADLEIGVVGETAPELRVQRLFRDRFVGVVRSGHPLLAIGEVTPDRYAAWGHVVASRRGRAEGPVDDDLKALGLARTIVAIVPGFPAAVRVARSSDLVALVTRSFLRSLRDDGGQGVVSFALPVRTPDITVSQMWHPRMNADPGHRWLRRLVLDVCGESVSR
ncbi:MAG: LysR family transcriptional regulator [Gammaproteobacteria bacterium]